MSGQYSKEKVDKLFDIDFNENKFIHINGVVFDQDNIKIIVKKAVCNGVSIIGCVKNNNIFSALFLNEVLIKKYDYYISIREVL